MTFNFIVAKWGVYSARRTEDRCRKPKEIDDGIQNFHIQLRSVEARDKSTLSTHWGSIFFIGDRGQHEDIFCSFFFSFFFFWVEDNSLKTAKGEL